VGLASALLLYLVFFAGNYLSRHIFPFAGDNIENVYSLKQGISSLRIIVLMALIIGPGEEIFWRAFLQRRCMEMWGSLPGTLAAVGLYTAVHLSSLNIMLLIAALVCGSFWGALYWRFRSPLLNMVSHTAWDIMVFVLVPFL